ncbi:RNA polymerase sigma factor [Blastococcus sp. TF02A-35]|uniref:RNA polymerase sigma factor n=1 Tax=Blastococcus sp. TF02A-35 TaxID=2559612 RepID=UPI0010744887|nr:RNA polymerase sigma factor [Blastococcus sp. TF02A_35]TFV51526.1 RNA polymerase sigma factor [Blastococcus sp. TF02A_35]
MTRDANPIAGRTDPMEERWVSLAREGDEDAFASLVRAHQDRLYHVALRLVGHPADAQDAVQECLLQAWQHLDGFRGEAQFSTWVTRILINRCHNVLRARKLTVPLPDDIGSAEGLPQATSAEDLAVRAQRRDAVRTAVLSLPFDQRAPLVLTVFGGYTHAEMGRILGISETAAKVRAHRGRKTLLSRLQEWR